MTTSIPIGKKPNFLKALFITGGRIEYFTADLTPYFVGIFLAFANNKLLGESQLWNGEVLLTILKGLGVVILAHYYTVLANVLADYEMDKRFKPSLSNSVDIVGPRRMLFFIWFFVMASCLLTYHLVRVVGNWNLMIFWLIGTVLSLIYSFEPLRLKKIPFLGDLGRGVPIVITMAFGYYLITPGFNILLLYCSVGLAVNLFGLFLVGETWDWKDDQGVANTVAVHYGYKTALKLALWLMPLGVLIWMYGFMTFSTLGWPMITYLIFGFVVLVIFFADYLLRVYRFRDDYDRIENHCGMITKVGTTSLWLVQLIGAIVLTLS